MLEYPRGTITPGNNLLWQYTVYWYVQMQTDILSIFNVRDR